MTKVSFYILVDRSLEHSAAEHSESAEEKLWNIAYRLCKKAMVTGNVTFLCDTDKTQLLSDFLWSQQSNEFFAHTVNGNDYINVTDNEEQITADIVINLTVKTLLQLKVKRILELVPTDEQSKQASRERYKLYRNNGFELENFDIPV